MAKKLFLTFAYLLVVLVTCLYLYQAVMIFIPLLGLGPETGRIIFMAATVFLLAAVVFLPVLWYRITKESRRFLIGATVGLAVLFDALYGILVGMAVASFMNVSAWDIVILAGINAGLVAAVVYLFKSKYLRGLAAANTEKNNRKYLDGNMLRPM